MYFVDQQRNHIKDCILFSFFPKIRTEGTPFQQQLKKIIISFCPFVYFGRIRYSTAQMN